MALGWKEGQGINLAISYLERLAGFTCCWRKAAPPNNWAPSPAAAISVPIHLSLAAELQPVCHLKAEHKHWVHSAADDCARGSLFYFGKSLAPHQPALCLEKNKRRHEGVNKRAMLAAYSELKNFFVLFLCANKKSFADFSTVKFFLAFLNFSAHNPLELYCEKTRTTHIKFIYKLYLFNVSR